MNEAALFFGGREAAPYELDWETEKRISSATLMTFLREESALGKNE